MFIYSERLQCSAVRVCYLINNVLQGSLHSLLLATQYLQHRAKPDGTFSGQHLFHFHHQLFSLLEMF